MSSMHIIPSQVRLISNAAPSVKYLVRVSSFKSLSDPYARVNVCMMDQDGNAFLQSVEPMFSRFNRGKSDFVLHAPSLDHISAIMMAPESGTWGMETIEVYREKKAGTGKIPMSEWTCLGKFTYGEVIGDNWKNMAAYVTQYDITPEITPEMRARYDQEYESLKIGILASTLQLTGVGSVATAIALGEDKLYAFLLGGGLAMMYAYMLQLEMDRIGKQNLFINSTTRLATLFASATGLTLAFQDAIREDNTYFIVALMGFMMFKLSVLRAGNLK